MKFTPVQDLLAGPQRFEAGNTYDTAKYPSVDNLEARVTNWHAQGMVAVEGQETKPLRDPIVIDVQAESGGS